MTVNQQTLQQGLHLCLNSTDLDWLGTKQEGKVRDSYSLSDGTRLIVTTDRISAFDRSIGTLPFKGQVLNQLAAWWFEQSKDLVPNHFLERVDPAAMKVIECTPLPVEFVMRAYLTGVTSTSVWTHYEKGERIFCGHTLPDGLVHNGPLPKAILTPSTKAEHGGHDQSVSREELLKANVIGAKDFDQVADFAHRLFAFGQAHCAKQGLILVDTKYEFGKTSDGTIVLIDEVHTPDSSRFWFASSYKQRLEAGLAPESFDKEYLRAWLKGQGFIGEGAVPTLPDDVRIEAARRYIQACESIYGQAFIPDLQEPHDRLRKNLSS
ncbi:MAG: phosphoribosylaminoimidazolesuccinocarboxamide synthase [Myxococcales bacterium]|nr:MAG: phosphoribosylaminoimidazolesuccinocarboxamide synthase [Myxococcales bacterium]